MLDNRQIRLSKGKTGDNIRSVFWDILTGELVFLSGSFRNDKNYVVMRVCFLELLIPFSDTPNTYEVVGDSSHKVGTHSIDR